MGKQCVSLWGVELSPFTLKLQACLDHTKTPYKRLPHHGSYLENAQTLLRLEYLKQRKLITRYPAMDKILDEYPAVPFFSEDGKDFQYDSSAIALYLDEERKHSASKLFPEDPVLNFIASLIDEAFDEFGLYMVHHMRWVGSAKSNRMGKLLAKEFRHGLPPGGPLMLSRSFPKRQVRRCPYLFSVAPKHYRCGMPKALTPPSKKGFPETHTLLFESWKQYLKGMEEVLSQRKYLLGDCFTIADASAYGQLAMNLVDPEAAEQIKTYAPLTFEWLNNIYRHHLTMPTSTPASVSDVATNSSETNRSTQPLKLDSSLTPLLNTIMSTFSTLMVQNLRAYHLAKREGIHEFNEAAFNKGIALYEGKLRGYPFRTVVKSFQVRVWNELCDKWAKLSSEDQETIKKFVNMTELFELS